ncbi:MAG TPA: protein kinase [Polyangiaceae bacterium]|nr:protein kinase [Polyangiaceae bacterium]
MDDTLLQFGRAAGAATEPAPVDARRATVCRVCGHHFSSDGRFCPFDGEPLSASSDWDPSLDPLIGSVIDNRYEVLSVLGEGGMGVVYAARHRALGKGFAVKALRKDLASDGEIAARFIQEARTAASVSHPGLVEITDFGKLPSGQPFFVMELLEGQSLAELIRRGGPIPAARAVNIVRQIAEALGAAHELSIVHRDLKPDNIHVATDDAGRDRVKIVDFGLAKVIGTSRLTRAGMVFGTPHYMSPEQAMGEATDHRADIYALGVVMYEMFTGRVPFEADSYMGVLTKHMYMAPTPLSQIAGTEKLAALEDVTLRCLEKKPDHRYQTLRELIHDLDRVFIATGQHRATPRHRRATPRSLLADELELPSREELSIALEHAGLKRWPRWPIVLIGGLFLLGIGSVLALRRPRAELPGQAVPSVPERVAPQPIVTAPLPALPAVSVRSALSAHPLLSAAPEPVASPVLPKPVRRTVERVAAPAPVTPSAAVAQKKPASLGASEIVDPWAK